MIASSGKYEKRRDFDKGFVAAVKCIANILVRNDWFLFWYGHVTFSRYKSVGEGVSRQPRFGKRVPV